MKTKCDTCGTETIEAGPGVRCRCRIARLGSRPFCIDPQAVFPARDRDDLEDYEICSGFYRPLNWAERVRNGSREVAMYVGAAVVLALIVLVGIGNWMVVIRIGTRIYRAIFGS